MLGIREADRARRLRSFDRLMSLRKNRAFDQTFPKTAFKPDRAVHGYPTNLDFLELKMNANLNSCRVCGFDCSPFFPWGIDGKVPSYSICPKCDTEFGYEDSSEEGIRRARARFFAQLSASNSPTSTSDWFRNSTGLQGDQKFWSEKISIEFTIRQRGILEEILGNANEELANSISRLFSGDQNWADIEVVCNAINGEFLMRGINPDYSPNAYGYELEELLDTVNRPRLRS